MAGTMSGMRVGESIRQKRLEQGLTLPELARMAQVSKGYLYELESGSAGRPSAATLYRIAKQLGATVADLLDPEGKGEAPAHREIPDGLRTFAKDRGLPEADIQMLMGISYRGQKPVASEDWAYIYDSIRMRIQEQRDR